MISDKCKFWGYFVLSQVISLPIISKIFSFALIFCIYPLLSANYSFLDLYKLWPIVEYIALEFIPMVLYASLSFVVWLPYIKGEKEESKNRNQALFCMAFFMIVLVVVLLAATRNHWFI